MSTRKMYNKKPLSQFPMDHNTVFNFEEALVRDTWELNLLHILDSADS